MTFVMVDKSLHITEWGDIICLSMRFLFPKLLIILR